MGQLTQHTHAVTVPTPAGIETICQESPNLSVHLFSKDIFLQFRIIYTQQDWKEALSICLLYRHNTGLLDLYSIKDEQMPTILF